MEYGRQHTETIEFAQRALLDFGLQPQFETRHRLEREECLRWVAAARDGHDEEERVTRMLDDLARGRPLPRLSDPEHGRYWMSSGLHRRDEPLTHRRGIAHSCPAVRSHARS